MSKERNEALLRVVSIQDLSLAHCCCNINYMCGRNITSMLITFTENCSLCWNSCFSAGEWLWSDSGERCYSPFMGAHGFPCLSLLL